MNHLNQTLLQLPNTQQQEVHLLVVRIYRFYQVVAQLHLIILQILNIYLLEVVVVVDIMLQQLMD